jgi:hypothetical protein
MEDIIIIIIIIIIILIHDGILQLKLSSNILSILKFIWRMIFIWGTTEVVQ